MPWGLVVLGALSYLAYRRARGARRNPVGWVLILWGALFGGLLLASLFGYLAVTAGAPFEVLPWTAIAGGSAGAGWAIREAGRPRSDPPA